MNRVEHGRVAVAVVNKRLGLEGVTELISRMDCTFDLKNGKIKSRKKENYSYVGTNDVCNSLIDC